MNKSVLLIAWASRVSLPAAAGNNAVRGRSHGQPIAGECYFYCFSKAASFNPSGNAANSHSIRNDERAVTDAPGPFHIRSRTGPGFESINHALTTAAFTTIAQQTRDVAIIGRSVSRPSIATTTYQQNTGANATVPVQINFGDGPTGDGFNVKLDNPSQWWHVPHPQRLSPTPLTATRKTT